MLEAFVPKITLPSDKTDIRKGDGFGIIINGKAMVIDFFDGGEATKGLISWFKSNGIEQIDLAVCTHAHSDHFGGFYTCVDSGLPIREFRCYHIDSIRGGNAASREDSDNLLELIRWLQKSGTRVLFIDHGDSLKFEDVTWKIYRNQPKTAAKDDTNAWEYVNNGSLVLWSPETQLLLGGDGPANIKYAISYFNAKVSGYDIAHHGNSCTESNAAAVKAAGCVVAWETCIERGGAGTTEWTLYGARRVRQAGIPVWMQNEPIYITAANGKIVFKQGSKTMTADIPYDGKGYEGWVHNVVGWWYRYSDGSWATGWKKIDGKWYYFDEKGYRTTGWQKVNGKWYYLDPDTGAMKTGWIFVNGIWYYLEDSGAMHTGWMEWKGKKCYLDPASGHCLVDCTRTIDGKTYRFDKGGYATEITGGAVIDRSKKFIDISEFQGDVDWSKAAGAVGAVYIRCGLRGSLKNTAPADYKLIRYDRKWARNLAAVQKHGVPFSAYYFPTAINDAEALEGAKWFYEVVKDLNLAFPPALDSENVWGTNKEAGRANGLSKSERTRLLKIVTDYFNERGMNIGIYASASWLNSKVDMSAFPQCVRDCTWVADSTGAVDYNGYYWLHQYGKGACAGFGDDVDLNRITGTIPPVRTDGKPQTTQPTEDPVDVLIRIMEAEVGTHEGPNNHTKYGDKMHAIQPSNMDKNAPWCDCWFDWCILKLCEYFGYGADMARKVLCGDFDDYTYASVALYKKAGRWFDSPQRGDQIFFGGQGHTGGVVSVYGGTENTIEGNKGDEVRRCSYSVNSPSIIGYGRPKYYLLTGKITAADMPLVKKGSKGDAVKKLQEMLIAKGYSCGKYGADSEFGSDTEAAVKAYQRDHGLTVDGEVGEKTWGSLFA